MKKVNFMNELQKMSVSEMNAGEQRLIEGGYVDPHPCEDEDGSVKVLKPIIPEIPIIFW